MTGQQPTHTGQPQAVVELSTGQPPAVVELSRPRTWDHAFLSDSRSGSAYDRFGKPVLDRVAGLVLLFLLMPVMTLVAVLILVNLGNPLLIRQRRVGRNGRVFGMYKFRTMHPDRRRTGVPLPAERDRRRTHKSDHDPRHTDIGRLLRRYSLDELPQLLNVIRGDMSLVGPRPELEHVVSGYAAWQHQRHQVKPGITGLWQVTERSNGELMMHHTATDLTYLTRMSLATDLKILLRTLPAAVTKPGS